MLNDNERCIRYVTNELEPSECMVFEKEMMENDDLLIEVETMRRTLKKLDNLPEYQPPRHLTEQIVNDAVALQSQKPLQLTPFPESGTNTKFFAAAAFILAGILLVSFNYSWNVSEIESQNPQQNEKTFAKELPNLNSAPASKAHKKTKVDPWVDRNDVIYFNATSNGQTNKQGNQSFYNTANSQKLVPLDAVENAPYQFSTMPMYQMTNANTSSR